MNNNLCNVAQSPAKKQLMVSMGQQQQTNTSIANGNLKASDMRTMMGKSIENLYEKKLSQSKMNQSMNNNEELTVEMANLEGIMKDLNAITAQQFEC